MSDPKIFVTSDTHWFHNNIIKYSNRPWEDVDLMSEALIRNWNNVVGEKDIVYHLGDWLRRYPPRAGLGDIAARCVAPEDGDLAM